MNAAAPTHSVSLQDLNLSVRTLHALNRGGAHTVDDLLELGMARIRRFDGIGPTSLSELKTAMESVGVTIKERPGRSQGKATEEKAAPAPEFPSSLFLEYENLPDMIPKESFLLALKFAFRIGYEWHSILPPSSSL